MGILFSFSRSAWTGLAVAILLLALLQTKDAIRQCNAVAGDPHNPDLVSYLGWEWTQVGIRPEEHYGHKNVIFRDTDDDKLPSRVSM